MKSHNFFGMLLLMLLPVIASGQEPDTVLTSGHRHDTILTSVHRHGTHFTSGHRYDTAVISGHHHDTSLFSDHLDDSVWFAGQEPDSILTLLFAGDIMGHDGQIAAALDDSTGTYSYDSVFKYISPVISAADVAIGNLEVTLGGAPYKGYPAFSSPDALAAACMNAGFDILVTANNHSADRGSKGLARTIRVLDSLGIKHTGTWISSESRDSLLPLMICYDSIRLALLGYTYGTNGIVMPPPALVSYIDTVRAATEIQKSVDSGADRTIIFIHWGTEYDTLPDMNQKKTAAALLRSGADIIIGSHPHVVQPMTAQTDSSGIRNPVVWSMGNFVSNQRTRRRDGGAMIRIDLRAEGDTTVITDAGYILTWVYTPEENGKRRFYVLPCAAYENRPEFFLSPDHYDAMMVYIKDARRLLDSLNTGFSEMTWAEGRWIKVERLPVSLN